eukprot:CAMPEP_0173107878 /NCGR_PEP_ID=MMETSP1102-20130122/42237_1 /TAXON_ID=49646 /ORGANISM="Geminigera sp., Strain Caron Lab Isolate" /LENGTH=41 /DNA_ID= /DNA_START= /DNA_END= /DNA_ORIENTATION=
MSPAGGQQLKTTPLRSKADGKAVTSLLATPLSLAAAQQLSA